MKTFESKTLRGLIALSVTSLLIACGSGNNTTATVGGTDVPIAATQDSAAAFNFILMVVNMGQADTATPLVLSDATNDPSLATSETADPMPVAA
jgi:hypothetical protein